MGRVCVCVSVTVVHGSKGLGQQQSTGSCIGKCSLKEPELLILCATLVAVPTPPPLLTQTRAPGLCLHTSVLKQWKQPKNSYFPPLKGYSTHLF